MKNSLLALLFLSKVLAAQQVDTFFKRPVAAISMTAPDAMGRGYFGNIGIGAGAQSTTRLNDKPWGPDANCIFTLGLGNPERYVGLDMRVNIYGTSDQEGQPDNLGEGTLDWHLNRLVGRRLWLGAGGYDLIGWDRGDPNKLHSVYACATTFLPLRGDNARAFSMLFLNVGVGNGRFRADKDFTLAHERPAGWFGSVAMAVLPRANAVVEWSGYGLYTGASFIPFKRWPFQISAGADDLFHQQWRWVLTASAGLYLKKKPEGQRLRQWFLPVVPPPQSSRV